MISVPSLLAVCTCLVLSLVSFTFAWSYAKPEDGYGHRGSLAYINDRKRVRLFSLFISISVVLFITGFIIYLRSL